MEDAAAIQRLSSGARAAAYWFVDGLPEIVFGLMYLVLGSLGLMFGYSPQNHGLKWTVIGFWVLFIVLYWWDRKIIDWIKARVTYPRTGYARPPKEPAPNLTDDTLTLRKAPPADDNVTWFRLRAAFSFVVGMQIVAFFSGRWTLVPVMAAVAALVYFGSRNDAHPYSWRAALLVALAGAVAAWLNPPEKSRQFVPLIVGGVWLTAQGGWTLVRYLRAHPRPAGEAVQS